MGVGVSSSGGAGRLNMFELIDDFGVRASAFPESGRSGTPKTTEINVRFRPIADVNWCTASQQPKEAVQMVGFGERRLIACGLTWSPDVRVPDVSGSWCLG